MDFEEAMLYAMEKGAEFIGLFYCFALNVGTCRNVMNDCLEKMQGIWKEMAAFEVVDGDGMVGVITNVQLVGWFFTAGLRPTDFVDMPREKVGYEYDRFLLNLLCDRAAGCYPSVEDAIKFMMK